MPATYFKNGNTGFLYYRDYFTDVRANENGILVDEKFSYAFIGKSEAKIKEINEALLKEKNRILKDQAWQQVVMPANITHRNLELKIAYPGLVTGIGIEHETGSTGEYKLGMQFDYTSGMPIIAGSSVKGILRTAFENEETFAFFLELAGLDSKIAAKYKLLKDEIFKGNRDKKPISIYQRDIFFDATIDKENSKGKFIDDDAITPHGNNPLKNPKPLAFIKIASGVIIRFHFKLEDSVVEGNFTKKVKESFFKTILTTIGIGAKTNVGYGQFTEN